MKNPEIKKILIIQTASIGDVVLATPVIEKLRHFYPEAIIDFLVKRGIESLLIGHPKLNHVLIWEKSEKKYQNLWNLIKKIRNEKYDVVINLQRFASSGLVSVLSGAGLTLGFNKNPFSLFFTQRVKHVISANPEKQVHETARNMLVINSITDNSSNFPMKLYPSPSDFAKVSPYKTSRYICVAPTSLWFTKQFPTEKWIEFLMEVDQDIFVYFLGSKGDFTVCGEIILKSGHQNSINLSGKLTFMQSAALMRDAAMNFVNDSAPQHFASAMNAPVTAIFCSTVPAFGFGPLSDNSAIIESDEKLACKPCGLHGFAACPEKHFRCALTIKKEKLLARII
jgi:heptosyltransferase-2